jgi:hypothetical protein
MSSELIRQLQIKQLQIKQALKLSPEVDLFRLCAVYDKGYCSRYVFHDGVFNYGGPIMVDYNIQEAHRNRKSEVVSWRDLGEERCLWCGVIGSIVHCGKCGCIVCKGRTTAAGWFKCRCGHENQLTIGRFINHGLAL